MGLFHIDTYYIIRVDPTTVSIGGKILGQPYLLLVVDEYPPAATIGTITNKKQEHAAGEEDHER